MKKPFNYKRLSTDQKLELILNDLNKLGAMVYGLSGGDVECEEDTTMIMDEALASAVRGDQLPNIGEEDEEEALHIV